MEMDPIIQLLTYLKENFSSFSFSTTTMQMKKKLSLSILLNAHSRLSMLSIQKGLNSGMSFDDILHSLQLTRTSTTNSRTSSFDEIEKPHSSESTVTAEAMQAGSISNNNSEEKEKELIILQQGYAGILYESSFLPTITNKGPILTYNKELIGNDFLFLRNVLKTLMTHINNTTENNENEEEEAMNKSEGMKTVVDELKNEINQFLIKKYSSSFPDLVTEERGNLPVAAMNESIGLPSSIMLSSSMMSQQGYLGSGLAQHHQQRQQQQQLPLHREQQQHQQQQFLPSNNVRFSNPPATAAIPSGFVDASPRLTGGPPSFSVPEQLSLPPPPPQQQQSPAIAAYYTPLQQPHSQSQSRPVSYSMSGKSVVHTPHSLMAAGNSGLLSVAPPQGSSGGGGGPGMYYNANSPSLSPYPGGTPSQASSGYYANTQTTPSFSASSSRKILIPTVLPSTPPPSGGMDESTRALFNLGLEIEKNEPIVRLLAHIRKAGMDILFPQIVHDKVLMCIYVAMKVTTSLAHRELIDCVIAVKDYNAISQLDHISRTKVRGVLALLKHAQMFITHGDENEAVRLHLNTSIASFKELREKHDSFVNKCILQHHLFIPLSLKGELIWQLDNETRSMRLDELKTLEQNLEHFFIHGQGKGVLLAIHEQSPQTLSSTSLLPAPENMPTVPLAPPNTIPSYSSALTSGLSGVAGVPTVTPPRPISISSTTATVTSTDPLSYNMSSGVGGGSVSNPASRPASGRIVYPSGGGYLTPGGVGGTTATMSGMPGGGVVMLNSPLQQQHHHYLHPLQSPATTSSAAMSRLSGRILQPTQIDYNIPSAGNPLAAVNNGYYGGGGGGISSSSGKITTFDTTGMIGVNEMNRKSGSYNNMNANPSGISASLPSTTSLESGISSSNHSIGGGVIAGGSPWFGTSPANFPQQGTTYLRSNESSNASFISPPQQPQMFPPPSLQQTTSSVSGGGIYSPRPLSFGISGSGNIPVGLPLSQSNKYSQQQQQQQGGIQSNDTLSSAVYRQRSNTGSSTASGGNVIYQNQPTQQQPQLQQFQPQQNAFPSAFRNDDGGVIHSASSSSSSWGEMTTTSAATVNPQPQQQQRALNLSNRVLPQLPSHHSTHQSQLQQQQGSALDDEKEAKQEIEMIDPLDALISSPPLSHEVSPLGDDDDEEEAFNAKEEMLRGKHKS